MVSIPHAPTTIHRDLMAFLFFSVKTVLQFGGQFPLSLSLSLSAHRANHFHWRASCVEEREKRKMTKNCKVSFVILLGAAIFALVLATFMPLAQAQPHDAFTPPLAPAPTSDGTYVLFLLFILLVIQSWKCCLWFCPFCFSICNFLDHKMLQSSDSFGLWSTIREKKNKFLTCIIKVLAICSNINSCKSRNICIM